MCNINTSEQPCQKCVQNNKYITLFHKIALLLLFQHISVELWAWESKLNVESSTMFVFLSTDACGCLHAKSGSDKLQGNKIMIGNNARLGLGHIVCIYVNWVNLCYSYVILSCIAVLWHQIWAENYENQQKNAEHFVSIYHLFIIQSNSDLIIQIQDKYNFKV